MPVDPKGAGPHNGSHVHPFLILIIGMLAVICGILLLRLHAFLALLLGAFVVAFLTPADALLGYALAQGSGSDAARAFAQQSLGERVAEGFGRTTGQVGIVIAMASIIGICLLESGAADRLVRFSLRLLGTSRAPLAFTGTGFLLAIPVFFDTVFYLMVPLAKATRVRTGKDYLFYVLAIVAGGTMAHSLVPPTPGPLFVANELGVDIGMMIVGGLLVGIPAVTAGFIFAAWANKRRELPLRDPEESLLELREIASRDEATLPPTWLAALPILFPVALISGRTLCQSWGLTGEDGALLKVILFAGEKNIALMIAAAVALCTMLWKETSQRTMEGIKKALTTAGVVILIIGAGGAFGKALQQTGIGAAIENLTTAYSLPLLPLAFLLTTLIRTAQGSATVAMITSAGTLMGLASAAQLGFHPVYLALAIGCGSKPIWWMNDSGFLVVSQMSGMTEREGLSLLTPLSAIMATVGLLVTILGAWAFPLV